RRRGRARDRPRTRCARPRRQHLRVRRPAELRRAADRAVRSPARLRGVCSRRVHPDARARLARGARVMATIRIPGALRALTGGAADIETSAATVREALAELDRKHPGIAARLLDSAGAVKPFIRIYVGPEDIG